MTKRPINKALKTIKIMGRPAVATQVSGNPNDFDAPISRPKTIHEKPITDLEMGLSKDHLSTFISRNKAGGMEAVAQENRSSEPKQWMS